MTNLSPNPKVLNFYVFVLDIMKMLLRSNFVEYYYFNQRQVVCDQCLPEMWYHAGCLGIKETSQLKDVSYVCNKVRAQNNQPPFNLVYFINNNPMTKLSRTFQQSLHLYIIYTKNVFRNFRERGVCELAGGRTFKWANKWFHG